MAACLRVLENGKQLPKHAKRMMFSLFDLWAGEEEEEDEYGHKEPEMISTVAHKRQR